MPRAGGPFGPKPRDPFERFVEKVEIDPGGCWLWTGLRFENGYGRITWGRAYRHLPVLAHRLAYVLYVGPLPPGYEEVIDHLCRVKHCVNPEHLELVPQSINLRRGVGVHKDYCSRGHPMTEDNIRVVYHRGYEDWLCRACRRDIYRAYDAKRRPKHARADQG